jgi:hypothetical protein
MPSEVEELEFIDLIGIFKSIKKIDETHEGGV